MLKNALFLAIILLAVALPASTSHGDAEPAGACPDDFVLHPVGHCDCGEHGEHIHAGVSTDRNDDGWICMKHVSVDGGVHVHIDNNKPLK